MKLEDSENISVADQVRDFYDSHPYPPPISELDSYRQHWQDEGRRRADYHLHWSHKTYREDITILVAGCGTSQAAKHAIRHPSARVVGVDLSSTSIQHTQELKRKYDLENLEVHQLAVERVGELGVRFDKIICTGVLHHLPDPENGLQALREVLEPEGSMHLMVYAAYGRVGIYMLQEYVRSLEIGDTAEEISDFAETLMALPLDHPLARLLGASPDFRSKAGLADALLNPQDLAYTIPELFEIISDAGLVFQRWVRQAPYLPQCGAFAETPHISRLMERSPVEQYAAMELLRGTMLRHNLILYRDDAPFRDEQITFQDRGWLNYVPFRLPETVSVEDHLPPGAYAVLINQSHADTDILLPVNPEEKQLYEHIDGTRSIGELIEEAGARETLSMGQVRSIFERLWWYDQVVFDASANFLS